MPLTWTAPQQPLAVSYYVEVVADGAPGARKLFSASTEVSSVLAPLPAGRYAGRVTVQAANGTHYAVGDWTRFSVAASLGPPSCATAH